MAQRIVLVEDVQAAELGYSHELGLLGTKGQILDDCLPAVEVKLLADGKAILEADWLKAQGGGKTTKRGRGPQENK